MKFVINKTVSDMKRSANHALIRFHFQTRRTNILRKNDGQITVETAIGVGVALVAAVVLISLYKDNIGDFFNNVFMAKLTDLFN